MITVMRKKSHSLEQRGCRNRRPDRVQDPLFDGNRFFDPEDLVQVKYEMLRQATSDGRSVSDAAKRFGFSRPAFYEAKKRFESEGLAGLLPKRPGPRTAHKLSEEVVDFVEQTLAEDPQLKARDVTGSVEERFGVKVHPRSVERALARGRKKNAARRRR